MIATDLLSACKSFGLVTHQRRLVFDLHYEVISHVYAGRDSYVVKCNGEINDLRYYIKKQNFRTDIRFN